LQANPHIVLESQRDKRSRDRNKRSLSLAYMLEEALLIIFDAVAGKQCGVAGTGVFAMRTIHGQLWMVEPERLRIRSGGVIE
jgi:hypothetical protein